MKELKTRNFESHLHKFNEMNDTVLVIDGNTMNITLLPENEELFFNIAVKYLQLFVIDVVQYIKH